MKKTAKTSYIKRKLPPELREVLDKLLTGNRHTLAEVTEHMKLLGADVSRSAVHRYSQELERVAGDIRLAREMAVAVGRELEAVPDGDAGRLVIESLQALLLRARMQVARGEELSVKEVGMLAGAARDLQAALRANVDTELKIRERAVKDAAEVAGKALKEQAGLSDETVAAIKQRILGVA